MFATKCRVSHLDKINNKVYWTYALTRNTKLILKTTSLRKSTALLIGVKKSLEIA